MANSITNAAYTPIYAGMPVEDIKLANKEYYFKQERKKSYKYVSEKLSEVDGLK